MRCAPDFRRAASQGLSGRGGPGGTSSSGTPTKTSRRRAGGREAVAGGQAGAVEAAGHRPGDACVPRGQLREGDSRGTKLKKKHLLHRLVKKVLIHSRKTVEIWYVLPNSQRFANCNIWLPICNRLRTSPGRVEPEIRGKILALPDDFHSSSVTERMLRPIGAIADQRNQVREFHRFLPWRFPPQNLPTNIHSDCPATC